MFNIIQWNNVGDHLKSKSSQFDHCHDISRFPCSQISSSSVIWLYSKPLLNDFNTISVFRFLFPASSKATPTCFVFGFQQKIFPSQVSEKTISSFHLTRPDIKSVLSENVVIFNIRCYQLNRVYKTNEFWKFSDFNKEPLFRYLGRFDFYLAVRHIIYFILSICFTYIIILDMTTGLITDTKDVMVEPLV